MPGPLTNDDLTQIFTYHPPDEGQQVAYHLLREAALEFSRVILTCTPACADQSAAIRHVREAVMTANAAVALKGRV